MKRAIGRGIPPIFDEAPSKEHGRTGGVYPGKLNPPRLLSKGSQQEARSPAAASLLVFFWYSPHFLKTLNIDARGSSFYTVVRHNPLW